MSAVDATSATEAGHAAPKRRLRQGIASQGAVLIGVIYVILWVVYAAEQPSALSAYSIESLLNNSLPLMLAAAGQTFVVLQGGFDLSVAGIISLSNVLVAVYPVEGPFGALVNLAMVVGVGLAVGATNGILVAYMRIQSIAATLATMIVCQGIALLILKAPGGYVSEFIAYELTGSLFGTVPVAAVIAVAVACIWLAFRRTNTGIALYAVGRDATAAELSGIDVRRTRFAAFCWAGVLYGCAGFMLSAQTSTGNPTAGEPFLLLCFAAVALGGTSFSGGSGGVIGSLIGAATLMLMQKVLFSTGVSSFYTGVFQGVVMIVAVLFAAFVQYMSRSRGNG
ncbi:ABC transporter permease [Microbaculum marinum]|uniref:ABC transporter permease n=1 Tax=Microbaculum marinum TaxID=1764581 RepID=A0AAW9RCM7_9HYPH